MKQLAENGEQTSFNCFFPFFLPTKVTSQSNFSWGSLKGILKYLQFMDDMSSNAIQCLGALKFYQGLSP